MIVSDTKFEQARQRFVQIIRHKTEMEERVMKLLKHPATTGSQIMEARQHLLAIEEPLARAVTKLREKYPYIPFGLNTTRPWHKPEFDKYDLRVKGGA